jgi:hypothetical protein
LRKLLGGSAEMFWKGAFPGISFEVNPETGVIELDDDEKEALRAEFMRYSKGLQRYLAVSGVTSKSLSPQVADPLNHLMAQLKALTISLGVPLRIFLGSEAAHLASTQDQENWNGRVARRQNKYVGPKIIRPFVERLMDYGVLPRVEDWHVEWPDLGSPGPKDKAEIVKAFVEALAKYVQGNVESVVPLEQFLTIFMDLDPDVVEVIVDAAEQQAKELEAEEAAMRDQMLKDGLDPNTGLPPDPNMPPGGAPVPGKGPKPKPGAPAAKKPVKPPVVKP